MGPQHGFFLSYPVCFNIHMSDIISCARCNRVCSLLTITEEIWQDTGMDVEGERGEYACRLCGHIQMVELVDIHGVVTPVWQEHNAQLG